MKIASKNTGLLIRFGVLASAMLFSQQAMAEGTRAGTSIANTATVDYWVGGIDQDDITSDPATATFVVDLRISFTLTPDDDANLVSVTPGGDDYFVDFTLFNASNDVLDFTLAVAEVAPSDGSVDINLDPAAASPEGGDEHYANLADFLPDDVLGRLASNLTNKYQEYVSSRKDWEKTYTQGLDLLGFKYDNITEPFQGASGATHPVLAEAVTQFQALAYKELLPADGPVRTQIIG